MTSLRHERRKMISLYAVGHLAGGYTLTQGLIFQRLLAPERIPIRSFFVFSSKVQPQVPFALLGVDENRATRSGGRPAIYGKNKRVWDAECGILGCRIQRHRYFAVPSKRLLRQGALTLTSRTGLQTPEPETCADKQHAVGLGDDVRITDCDAPFAQNAKDEHNRTSITPCKSWPARVHLLFMAEDGHSIYPSRFCRTSDSSDSHLSVPT